MIDRSNMTTKRKFHDAWAFFLYAIVTSAVYGVAASQGDSLLLRSIGINYHLAAVALGYLAAFVFATVFLFRFLPKFTLHFSFLGGNILNLYFLLHFRNTYALIYAVLWSVNSMVFYFLYGYRYIAFTSVILRDSARILIAYFTHFVLAVVVSMALLVAHYAAIFFCAPSVFAGTRTGALEALFVLNYFWTESNMLYVLAVFSSSIAGIHVLSRARPRRVLSGALRNTFFALGSICMGGLVIAVIKTLQHFVHRSHRDRKSLLVSILNAVCMLLLYFLEDIARTINDWAFPYLAIHGTSFKSSAASSFQVAVQGRGAAIMASSCINMAIFFAVATGFLGSLALVLFVFTITEKTYFLNFEGIASTSHTSVVLLLVFMLSFILNFAELFSALSKTIMFLYVENPGAVAEVLPDSGHAMQQKTR